MAKKQCLAPAGVVRAFLESADDNWRNSFYIECSGCKYEKAEGCGDFLFVPASSGQPVLLPIHDAEIIFGLLIDKSECLGVMGNLRFAEFYRKWIAQSRPAPDRQCPLLNTYQNSPFCAKYVQKLSQNP